jgi:hypothetical protein
MRTQFAKSPKTMFQRELCRRPATKFSVATTERNLNATRRLRIRQRTQVAAEANYVAKNAIFITRPDGRDLWD